MDAHTVIEADAKEQLSELIDRALNGEEVVISRDGRTVVSITAVPRTAGFAPYPENGDRAGWMEWLDRHSIGRIHPTLDGPELVRQMRDEGY